MLNILHDQLLRLGQFCGGEGVGLADDGDDINTGRQALHQFDIELAEAVASGCDEVEKHVNAIVPETGVTLDPGLLCKNIIVLALKVADNLAKAISGVLVGRGAVGFVRGDMPGLVVNLVTETGGVDDGQGDTSALLIQFELC